MPCGPALTYPEVMEHEQFLENEYIIEKEHPEFGTQKTIGVPVSFEKTPGAVQGFAPKLGEHNREVLLGLGYTEEAIAALERSKVTSVAERAYSIRDPSGANVGEQPK